MCMPDTNTASHLFSKHPEAMEKIQKIAPSKICISSITEVEQRYGLAKRQSRIPGQQKHLVSCVQCGLWERSQLIAAHASSTGMMIVTSDAVFLTATGLSVDDWGLVNYQTAGYSLDLQQVTAKLMGRDAPTYQITKPVIQTAREKPGEWLTVDGIALKICAYKGNVVSKRGKTWYNYPNINKFIQNS